MAGLVGHMTCPRESYIAIRDPAVERAKLGPVWLGSVTASLYVSPVRTRPAPTAFMQLGFVIDHSKCIGCHACTVACKSENDVPLGSFRTWVKYTETGTFPANKRNFAVLRCNQCVDPPCVEICPTVALTKGDNGIVDIDPKWCVGCKSCTMACPYDSIYINPNKGTAEKCHFCANRVEEGLAPACVSVCPTEALIPGDFDDPKSRVHQMLEAGGLTARKTEAMTKPSVYYKEAAPAGLDPINTSPTGGYLWANRRPEVNAEAEAFLAELMAKDAASTTLNVDRPVLWGEKVSNYLMTKSISAGVILAALPLVWNAADGNLSALTLPLITALVFLIATVLLLIFDLKRPERFLFLLTHPNWDSWLVRGGIILTIFGGLLAAGIGANWFEIALPAKPMLVALGVGAAATAGYTASLFAQAKGRVLWMQRGMWPTLIVQALVAGAAALLLMRPFVADLGMQAGTGAVQLVLLLGLGLHLIWFTIGHTLSPGGAQSGRTEEYSRAWALFARGPRAKGLRLALVGWIAAMACLVLAHFLVSQGSAAALLPYLDRAAAVLALIGLHRVEHDFVRVGQEVPIS